MNIKNLMMRVRGVYCGRNTRLEMPRLPGYFSKLTLTGKVAEIVLNLLLKAEYSLSPGGGLRRWLKLNLTLSGLLLIPGLLLLPVVLMIAGSLVAIIASVELILKSIVACIMYSLCILGSAWAFRHIIQKKSEDSLNLSATPIHARKQGGK